MFSPYYAFARRRGAADPTDHVAINVALYGPGGAWAMTERGRGALDRDATGLSVGPSAMRVDGNGLTITIDEIAVPIPRRIRGTVRLRFNRVETTDHALDPAERHWWRPIAPIARVEVTMDAPALSWSGSAYVDHNRGAEPIEAGFVDWTWTRATDGRGTVVTYALRPRAAPARAFAIGFDGRGRTEMQDAPPHVELPKTGWRLRRSTRADAGADVRILRDLEDTPFYSRSILSTQVFGRSVAGMHESLSLDRFKSPVVQAMLPFRMPRRPRWG